MLGILNEIVVGAVAEGRRVKLAIDIILFAISNVHAKDVNATPERPEQVLDVVVVLKERAEGRATFIYIPAT